MKVITILFSAAVLALPAISQAAMGVDYHENARSICQVRAHLKAGKRFPVDAQRARSAKVVPIRKGQALEVTAWDEANGQRVECRCTVVPGDADLYPAVRLQGDPVCTTS
jgi:hypothetical protein